ANARRPLLVLGGSGWDGAARKRLGAFVEANGLPVATSFRRQDLFDNRDPHYAGLRVAAPSRAQWLGRLQERARLLSVGCGA
ncbi:thiamine pyrophosphate-binding protein, partial [Pseudomonas aeruginosa]